MGDWQIADSGSGSGGGAEMISTGGGAGDKILEAIFGPETDLEAGS